MLATDCRAILETSLRGAVEGTMATRKASGAALAVLAERLPQLWGGSADLAGSNNTEMRRAHLPSGDAGRAQPELRDPRAWHGRDHERVELHGGLIPYGGTFLTFSDYMRGAIRLAALMEQRVVYVFTHDSIFLGEDGPTHQAVEHWMALRLIPNLDVLRPCDACETAACWLAALKNTSGPALLLTRQGLPALDGTEAAFDSVSRGAYVLARTTHPTLS